jgi:hypothetical protein
MKLRDLSRDASIAIASVHADGFLVLGAPRRKPKHFELLAKKQDGLNEVPVELDGHIRKSRPVSKDDHKWSAEPRGEA